VQLRVPKNFHLQIIGRKKRNRNFYTVNFRERERFAMKKTSKIAKIHADKMPCNNKEHSIELFKKSPLFTLPTLWND
jgi:hypothetical protein